MLKYILPIIFLSALPANAAQTVSKSYEVYGRVVSIKEMRPYNMPPIKDKCYEKHNQTVYKIVTMQLTWVKPVKEGTPIQGLETKPAPRYYTFALDDKDNGFVGESDFGKIQELDTFTADANYSTDECLNETWLSNIKFSGRILSK